MAAEVVKAKAPVVEVPDILPGGQATVKILDGDCVFKEQNYPAGKGLCFQQICDLTQGIFAKLSAEGDHAQTDMGTGFSFAASQQPNEHVVVSFDILTLLPNPYSDLQAIADTVAPGDLRLKAVLSELGVYAHICKSGGRHLLGRYLPMIEGLGFGNNEEHSIFWPGIVMENLVGKGQMNGHKWAVGLKGDYEQDIITRAKRQEEFCQLLTDLRDVYKALSEIGIWHNDYKPANLMFGHMGLRLVDLGAATIDRFPEAGHYSISLNNAAPEDAWIYAMSHHLSDVMDFYNDPASHRLQHLPRSQSKSEVFQIAMTLWQLIFDDLSSQEGVTNHLRGNLLNKNADGSVTVTPMSYFDPINYVMVSPGCNSGPDEVDYYEPRLNIPRGKQRSGLGGSDWEKFLEVLQAGIAFDPNQRQRNVLEFLEQMLEVFSPFPNSIAAVAGTVKVRS